MHRCVVACQINCFLHCTGTSFMQAIDWNWPIRAQRFKSLIGWAPVDQLVIWTSVLYNPSTLKIKEEKMHFFFDFRTRNWNIKLVLTTLGKALGTIRISFIVADCGLCKKCAKTARHMILHHYYRSVQNIPSRIAEGPRDATTQWQRRSFKLRDRMVNFLKKSVVVEFIFYQTKKETIYFWFVFRKC